MSRAEIPLTLIVNNTVKSMHLCEACAGAMGICTSPPTGSRPLADILTSVDKADVLVGDKIVGKFVVGGVGVIQNDRQTEDAQGSSNRREPVTPAPSRNTPTRPRRARKVRAAPGNRLLWWADFLCSPTTCDRVFNQIVIDLREEYNAALDAERPWKARWVRIRGCSAFSTAAVAQLGVSFGKTLVRIWKLVQ